MLTAMATTPSKTPRQRVPASERRAALIAMGNAYVELLRSNRDYLMLQLHSYAACDDPEIRDRVRVLYARLVAHVERLSGAEAEEIDEFFRYGMWLNVAAAMGVEDLS